MLYGGNLTPTQIAAIERSKAFKAQIAERAAKVQVPKNRTYFIPNTPYGVPKEAPAIKTLPPIPDEAMREACEFPSSNQFGPKVEFIVRTVAKHFGISTADILAMRRTAKFVLPRQVAMYLAKTLTLRSLPEIGRRLNGRDHTTVLHAVRKIERLIKIDPDLAARVKALTKELTA